MLAAIVLFTLMDATAKGLIAHTPALLVIWARFAGMFLIVALLFNRRIPALLRTRFPVMHFWRSAFQFGATALFFISLAHIGLAEATALTDINPVLITLGAALFLGEKLGPRRIMGVVAAMCGALIVIRPGMGVFTPAALLPIGAAICYTGNALLTRRIGPHEPAGTALIYAAAFGTILGACALPFVWQPIPPADIARLALIAALGTGAQFCIIRSFSITEASIVAPFAYVGIVMATIWGIIFFDEYPDGWTIVGALVIVTAGLYVWHRETMQRRP
jgi:drug/metabolite transporter (DMT)-like permease